MPKPNHTPNALEAYLKKLSSSPSRRGIVTEGDSWFAFPLASRPNVISKLVKRLGNKAAWLRLEANGDEARSMLSGEQWEKLYRVFTSTNFRCDMILLSAGGNDIVGRCLLPLLKQKEPWMTWRDCIQEFRVENRLNQIEGAYHELLALRDEFQPNAWVFAHDYDRVVPVNRPIRLWPFKIGPWMYPYLLTRQISEPSDQIAIMDYLLDAFASRLRKIEQMYSRFYYVKTQGTLTVEEWGDEIHPTDEGFTKISEKIRAAIVEIYPELG